LRSSFHAEFEIGKNEVNFPKSPSFFTKMKDIIIQIQQAIRGTIFAGKTFIIGGYVRDKLLNINSFDLDIVVELPNGGEQLAQLLYEKKLSGKPVLYQNFGTSYVKMQGKKVELLMTRKESYREKNRKPDVVPATLKEDIERRDFTINTLAIDIATGKLLDISGKGIADLEKKIIRTVGEPESIFTEDPLRLLRAIRFAKQLNFQLEEKTQQAITLSAEKLAYISWERKKEELEKMLLLPQPSQAIRQLMEFGLMNYIIPELAELQDLQQNKYHHLDALNHTLLVLDLTKPLLLHRFAALLHDIGKKRTLWKDENGKIHFHKHEIIGESMAKNILRRLTYSSHFINDTAFIIKNHMRFKKAGTKAEEITDKTLRRIILQARNRWNALLDVIHADNCAHSEEFSLPQQIPQLKKRVQKLQFTQTKQKMPIDGNTIKTHFSINEGKLVGDFLKKAEEIWLENPDISEKKLLKELEKTR
jgi:poly(A) polymerase